MMLGAIVRCKGVFPFGCIIPLQSGILLWTEALPTSSSGWPRNSP